MKEEKEGETEDARGDEGTASFVKGRQCGTWCTITPATRAHGVRRRSQLRGLKGRWMPDDIMTDGDVSVCSSGETRNEGAAVAGRVSFVRSSVSTFELSVAVPRCQSFSRHHRSSDDRVLRVHTHVCVERERERWRGLLAADNLTENTKSITANVGH